MFADAEQSAVPAAVASKVVTLKSFKAEVAADVLVEAAVDKDDEAVEKISPPVDIALLIAAEPKVSCTKASIASCAAAGSVGHIA